MHCVAYNNKRVNRKVNKLNEQQSNVMLELTDAQQDEVRTLAFQAVEARHTLSVKYNITVEDTLRKWDREQHRYEYVRILLRCKNVRQWIEFQL